MTLRVLDTLLHEISGALSRRDAAFLTSALPINGEVLFQPPYSTLVQELNERFPFTSHNSQEEKLERHCAKLLPINEDFDPDGPTGTAWPAFITFVKEYFICLRDRHRDSVRLHEDMVNLLTHCITALTHSSLGLIVLGLCLEYARVLKALSLTFERTEEVKRQTYNARLSLKREGQQSFPTMQTPAERVAETLQKALNACLADRSGGGGPGNRFARPTGKRVAIYQISNIIAKCLEGSGNLSGLATLFSNIQKLGPPLEYYPAAQRVTYLYYLGRYQSRFDNFYRAVQCLEAAYMQCPRQCVKQRRQILRHLLADSIVLGRFPSQQLLSRPEAEGLGDYFLPICYAVRKGDFGALKSFLGENGDEAESVKATPQAAYAQAWLRKFGLLYKMQSHLKLSTWRCLIRKTFIIGGFHGDGGKKPPMVDFDMILSAAEHVDPFLIWPEGKRPWYQDIGDREEWLKQKTDGWRAKVSKDWEVDPDQSVARWPWEPDFEDFPQRLKRKSPFGQANSEDSRLPLNNAEYDEWTIQEQHRHRTLMRYLAKLQRYRKDAGLPDDPAADSKWLQEHCMPAGDSEQEMTQWWTQNIVPTFTNQAADSTFGINKRSSNPFQMSAPAFSQPPFPDPQRRSSSPLFVPDFDQTISKTQASADDYDSDSDTWSASSFSSEAAAESAWTGGTFLLSRPHPFPTPLPHRSYPPPPPKLPPPPLDTDMIIINTLSNLVSNGLINGFVSWTMRAFAIEGAKRVGALEAGFPRVWDVVRTRARQGEAKVGVKEGWVPGWIREDYEPKASAGGGVVRLGSARPAGS